MTVWPDGEHAEVDAVTSPIAPMDAVPTVPQPMSESAGAGKPEVTDPNTMRSVLGGVQWSEQDKQRVADALIVLALTNPSTLTTLMTAPDTVAYPTPDATPKQEGSPAISEYLAAIDSVVDDLAEKSGTPVHLLYPARNARKERHAQP